ncbi:adenylate cyclase [Amylibacter marinus]|uniref:Adenylate cyclase n=1 Tax=Amylibacter marinus TaxID=1475483 RepID=A0ABQ5VXW8_9RHOB|nr:adenylate/guanylate cyclase domain-containing protein [Amylibacter marinus]GLQ36081.1 adenylate cyclase [Amylibacter marinus]
MTLKQTFLQQLFLWLETGTQDFTGHTRRRLIVINALMTVIPSLAFIYVVVLSIIDFSGFRMPILFITLGAPLFLITPFLWQISVRTGTIFNLCYWLVFNLILSMLLGRESGIHLLFLAGTTMSILIFGVRFNLMSLISLSSGVVCYSAAQKLFIDHSAEFVTASPESIGLVFYLSTFIYVMVNFCIISYAFAQAHRAERLLETEYAYSEGLLNSMMPRAIADQLKTDRQKVIAESYDEASILFADLAGFTDRASRSTPTEVVNFLNLLFTRFDQLAVIHGVEKIKTLGDSYMAAGGLPRRQADHAERIANFALDVIQAAETLSESIDEKFQLRVGFHSGPVVAGVIGAEKPFYDVWGDTVNTAERLENLAEVGRVQVTYATKVKLEHKFNFEKRGNMMMKGKGEQEVWYLLGPK